MARPEGLRAWGRWRQMVENVKRATSAELHLRLGRLSSEKRAAVTAEFERMKLTWCEEMSAKFAYWDELPHCIFGMWPRSPESRAFAQKALGKWEEAKAADKLKQCHRVTYRLLHPASGFGFRPLIEKLASEGRMDAALEIELQEINMVATSEQRVEEIHARIFQLNASVGRNLDPASTCARPCYPEHVHLLGDWRCHVFLVHSWNRHVARELQFCMESKQFVKHATYVDCHKAVHHCLPEQLFKNVNEDKLVHHPLKLAIRPAAVQNSVHARLFLECCRGRFQQVVVISMPRSSLQPDSAGAELILGPGGGAAAAFDETALVEEVLAMLAAEQTEPTLLRMGMQVAHHRFFRVIRSNIPSRFLQHSDDGSGGRLSLIELVIGGRDGEQGLFPQPRKTSAIPMCCRRFEGWARTVSSRISISGRSSSTHC